IPVPKARFGKIALPEDGPYLHDPCGFCSYHAIPFPSMFITPSGSPSATVYHRAVETGRTSEPFEVWQADALEQVAVAWVLSCAFLRYLEDNDLVDDVWLAGSGERGARAQRAQSEYFQTHPTHSDREYCLHVFRAARAVPVLSILFDEGRS